LDHNESFHVMTLPASQSPAFGSAASKDDCFRVMSMIVGSRRKGKVNRDRARKHDSNAVFAACQERARLGPAVSLVYS
jgi:hypothetical protein